VAKLAQLTQLQANRDEYGQSAIYLLPTNLYGPGDKFHESISHVIPALIKKCVDARDRGLDKVHVWGTGSESRDYLFVGDAADAIVLAAELHDATEPLNLGNNREITIRETAETIARVVGFTGDLVWDSTKPDGQPRRRVDASRAEAALGWHAHTSFEQGLRETVEWYLSHRAVAEAEPR
jgi:GDP-L-fucose synthase